MTPPLNFSVWNHEQVSRITLRDLIDPMIVSLLNLGYPAPVISDNWSNFPVLFECFTHETADYVKKIGKPFGLIVTEWYDGNRLYGQPDERTFAFQEVVKKAKFLWAVVDQPAYREIGVPYAPIPPSWEQAFFIEHREEPIFDLCAFGSPNYLRRQLKEKLDKLGINYTWLNPGTPASERNMYIAKSRFVLGLPAWGAVGEPSPGRINIALHNNRGVLNVEEIDHFWDLRDNWENIRDQQLAEYQAQGNFRAVMQNAMDVAGFERPHEVISA